MDKTLNRYQRFCKAFIRVIFADSSTGVCPVICLQYLQNMRTQDTWFLLLISAIVANLRYVGEYQIAKVLETQNNLY